MYNGPDLHLVDFHKKCKITLLFWFRGNVSSPSSLLNDCVKQTKMKRVIKPLLMKELHWRNMMQPPLQAGTSMQMLPGWGCPRLTPGSCCSLARSHPDWEGGTIFISLERKTKQGVYLKFCVKLYLYELHVVMLMLFSLSENFTVGFNYTEWLHVPA